MQDGLYNIKLKCTNCMHKWDHFIPKGERFFSYAYLVQTAGHGLNSWDAYDNLIICPNCECGTVVRNVDE